MDGDYRKSHIFSTFCICFSQPANQDCEYTKTRTQSSLQKVYLVFIQLSPFHRFITCYFINLFTFRRLYGKFVHILLQKKYFTKFTNTQNNIKEKLFWNTTNVKTSALLWHVAVQRYSIFRSQNTTQITVPVEKRQAKNQDKDNAEDKNEYIVNTLALQIKLL